MRTCGQMQKTRPIRLHLVVFFQWVFLFVYLHNTLNGSYLAYLVVLLACFPNANKAFTAAIWSLFSHINHSSVLGKVTFKSNALQ